MNMYVVLTQFQHLSVFVHLVSHSVCPKDFKGKHGYVIASVKTSVFHFNK